MLLLRERETERARARSKQSLLRLPSSMPCLELGWDSQAVLLFHSRWVGACVCIVCMCQRDFFHVYFNKKARRSGNRLHRVDPHQPASPSRQQSRGAPLAFIFLTADQVGKLYTLLYYFHRVNSDLFSGAD